MRRHTLLKYISNILRYVTLYYVFHLNYFSNSFDTIAWNCLSVFGKCAFRNILINRMKYYFLSNEIKVDKKNHLF